MIGATEFLNDLQKLAESYADEALKDWNDLHPSHHNIRQAYINGFKEGYLRRHVQAVT